MKTKPGKSKPVSQTPLFNIIMGLIFGLAPIIAFSFIGLSHYQFLSNLSGIIIISCLMLGAFWLGIKIFRKVQVVGPFEFITAFHASPDIDNLELNSDDTTKNRVPDQLVSLIKRGNNLCKGGALRIFGAWVGKPDDNHIISNAEYNDDLVLVLQFQQGEKLIIKNPIHIMEAPTFLKILKADEIRLEWYDNSTDSNNVCLINYKLIGNKIITETNIESKKLQLDTSLGAPALMIYGKIN